MKKNMPLIALMFVFAASNGFCADDLFGIDDVDSETITETTAQSVESAAKQEFFSKFLNSRLPASAARNIEKAEKVFCYTVAYAQPNEGVYTVNDLAIKGSCGELSDSGKKLFNDALWRNTTVFSNQMDNCKIAPKIMLRYIYGPDSTDVLLSYPCPAVTFYHGRDVVTINAAPGAQLFEQITKAYATLSEPYISPALVGQMLPNGQILNQEQKEMVRRLGLGETPNKRWGQPTSSPTQPASAATPKTGWNKLK